MLCFLPTFTVPQFSEFLSNLIMLPGPSDDVGSQNSFQEIFGMLRAPLVKVYASTNPSPYCPRPSFSTFFPFLSFAFHSSYVSSCHSFPNPLANDEPHSFSLKSIEQNAILLAEYNSSSNSMFCRQKARRNFGYVLFNESC